MPNNGKNPPSQEEINNSIENQHPFSGDPNCPICHGSGYVRLEVPLGHPQFGKIQICECRASQARQDI
ncbi:MAG: hypothetical protein ACPL6F_03205, partial [Anaerolineales bacterium]